MKFARLMLACLLPLSVSACGIPDLVAHGVKEFDRSQRKGDIQPAATPAPAVQRRVEPAVVQDEPPIYSGPAAPAVRDPVMVETLPPAR